MLIVAVALALVLFCVARRDRRDLRRDASTTTAFVNNIVILPLTFLGGVFYSVDLLPRPWQEISHVNPIFYLVQAVRYGFLGTSDVSVRSRSASSARSPRSSSGGAPGCSRPVAS